MLLSIFHTISVSVSAIEFVFPLALSAKSPSNSSLLPVITSGSCGKLKLPLESITLFTSLKAIEVNFMLPTPFIGSPVWVNVSNIQPSNNKTSCATTSWRIKSPICIE